MSKEKKAAQFNPNEPGDSGNTLFGLPFTPEEAELVIIPVPWEVTVSYSAGTAKGPEAVYDASFQVDLYDPYVKNAWKLGLAMLPIDKKILSTSNKLRKQAEKYIDLYAQGKSADKNKFMRTVKITVDEACMLLNAKIKKQALKWMQQKKTVALLGGDHSTPLGLMQAVAEVHPEFGILQLDAHADLRIAYEGFEYSHASIMHNALQLKQVKKLVQVGIRDYCEDEMRYIKNEKRITTFFDKDLKHAMYEGENWKNLCKAIVNKLPSKIYLSIDIDGLDPKLCPSTGTPVPGGLEFEQVVYLIEKVVESGKKIIAFDINEVAPGKTEWDANVGARLLYKISNLCLISNGVKA
jgi:agmatinase